MIHKTAIIGGLDMEFGSWTDGLTEGASNAYDNYWLANPYLKGIKEGIYTDKELNEKVRRVLRLTFRTAMNSDRPWGSMVADAHKDACRKVGAEGMVLLQNNEIYFQLIYQR